MLVPLLAFFAWTALIFHYFSVVKLDLALSEQILASLLFVSHLILILVWSTAGPVMAAALTASSAFIVLYLCLALKEPVLFIQVITYGFLYLCLAVFLYEMQKRLNDSRLRHEWLEEESVLTQREWVRKEELGRALERRIDRFLDLHQFAETLKGVPTVPQLAHRVVQEAHVLVPRAEECVLYLVDEKNEKLSWIASSHPKKISERGHGSVYDQWVMRRARPLIIEDAMTDFRFARETREELGGLRSVCAAPLMTENKVLGVLRASAPAHDVFTSDDLHALDIISGLAAVTLRNRLLYDKTEELAIRDGLTGLYLNRYFKERLAEEITRVRLKSGKLSLILLDIDNFKKTNDEFGHTAGDLALKNVASILLRYLEPSEIAARYGGEEFVLLLPNKTKAEAMVTAEKMRSEIEQHQFVLRRIKGSVTASFGVSSSPEDGKTSEDLLASADKRLYEAKKRGRNRVCGNI